MFLALHQVLTASEVAALLAAIDALDFADGRATAGRHARAIKANEQACASAGLEAVQIKVTSALMAHPVFASAARPRAMSRPIISRYRPGHAYGLHVDDALMQGIRTDLSFTLFLSSPEICDGGALIVADTTEERSFRLGAGDAMLYPSTTLHRVEPVRSGTRICAVGWVQSWVRSADQREILFDLDRAIADVHGREGKSALLDTLTKTRSNLLRMWAG